MQNTSNLEFLNVLILADIVLNQEVSNTNASDTPVSDELAEVKTCGIVRLHLIH